MNALIRRSTGSGGTRPLELGNLVLDPAKHEVTVGGAQVPLRAKEFELLEAFCRQPGIVLTRHDVMRHCAANLEDFMVPQVVEFRDVLPQTTTGKISKRELSAPAGVDA